MLDLNIIREHPTKCVRRWRCATPMHQLTTSWNWMSDGGRCCTSRKTQGPTERRLQEIGKMNAARAAGREEKIAEMRAVGDQIGALDAQVSETEVRLQELMLTIPISPTRACRKALTTVKMSKSSEWVSQRLLKTLALNAGALGPGADAGHPGL